MEFHEPEGSRGPLPGGCQAPDRSACWFALFPRLAAVRERVGIGGVVAALSVASDLTRGHPPGEAMRACLLATELARRAGLDRVRQGEVYYGTLLRFAGCGTLLCRGFQELKSPASEGGRYKDKCECRWL